jgi:redox-sensing transcriptional repressor
VSTDGKPRLGRRVLERLMRYYRFLSETTARKPLESVTSAHIAAALDIDATQVRKDFGAIGVLGMGRVGFDVCEVCRGIRVALGFDQPYQAVVVGTGHLGSALLAYPGFATYGLEIVAAFDKAKGKIGTTVGRCPVKSMRSLKPFIRKHGIRLAIITTPASAAQTVADRVVSAGVSAIWNFSPTQLVVPRHVYVRNEHISLGLSVLAYHLKR